MGCGSGGDVDLGRLSVGSGGHAGGSGGAGLCGSSPCANYRGTRVFFESGLGLADVDGFVAATEHAPGSDAQHEPGVLYPSDETMLPLDLSRIRHEWSPADNTLFELDFDGPNTQVRLYTAATSFTPTDDEWDWIAESNRGQAVSFSLRALNAAAPGDAWRSRAITLYFSADALEGSVYYWSTASPGVMKVRAADATPVRVFSDPRGADAGSCVGCHALARDGSRLAVSDGDGAVRLVTLATGDELRYGSGGGGAMDLMKMPGKASPAPAPWSAFSPDGKLLLVASGGKLTVLDAETALPVAGGGAVPMPPGMIATQPDWSNAGDRVAVTLSSKASDRAVENGSIALIPFQNGQLGDPEVIVASGPGMDNNFAPAFSPDDRFLAFVRAKGKSADAASAVIALVDLGSRSVIELTRSNQRVNDSDGNTNLGNTLPTWAPSTTPGRYWLAFSSLRPYASVRPLDKKLDQIWIAALDPTQADPSFAAFWAPFQLLDQGNHRALWAPAANDRACLCSEICGDGIDNDCDGAIDEADCVAGCAEHEICDNGLDDDCDCVSDDCSLEVCDDHVDNDGDGRVDMDDPACAPH